MDCSPPGSSVHGILQAGIVGSHSFLQGFFPTQGSNLGLPHGRQTLYHLSHQGSLDNSGLLKNCNLPGSSVHVIFQARILEWVAIPYSRGSSNPGIKPASLAPLVLAGRFLTPSPTWKATLGFSSVQFSHSVVSSSLRPHGLQHTRPLCPSLTPGACSNSCPSNW